MSEENNVTPEDDSYLELSDEELMNMPSPPYQADPEEDSEDEEEEYEEESLDEEEDFEEEEEEEDDEPQPTSDNIFDNDDGYEDNVQNEVEKPSTKEESSSSKVDYKEAYEKIFKPFKANGKEIQVKNPEEAIQLMQMGANYNKKMAGIKQQLPILKMLEKNNLLDERKLSYAVDLMNGDKAAIARLVKETEVDLYDIDEESGDTYEPSYKGVSDQEMQLTQTIEDLRDSPAYDRTIEIATDVWDSPSQQFIVNNPGVLNVLAQHIESGIFDTIWNEAERLMTIGELPQHLNSLEAYKVTGDHMNEQGLIGEGNSNAQAQQNKTSKQEATKRKKQATQKPKSAGRNQTNNNAINPLELSDEEFEKLGAEHLM